MMKKTSFLLAALAFASVLVWACNKPEPEKPVEKPVEEVELIDLKLSVPVTEDWIFTDKPPSPFRWRTPTA